ncbi:MAG: long-chain fatty acid transport protein, partial [bacterium]
MISFKKCLCLTTAFIVVAPYAAAAGFQLKEQSASLQGLSFAGATAKANDASTIFFNPAGMTRLGKKEVLGNVSFIKPTSEFNVDSVTAATGGGASFPISSDDNGGDPSKINAVPSLYGLTTFDNGVKFGLSVNTPFGLSTNYNEGWVGRYYALKSDLLTINISPNFAYKFNDKLSLGVGAEFQYIEAELSSAINVDSFIGG